MSKKAVKTATTETTVINAAPATVEAVEVTTPLQVMEGEIEQPTVLEAKAPKAKAAKKELTAEEIAANEAAAKAKAEADAAEAARIAEAKANLVKAEGHLAKAEEVAKNAADEVAIIKAQVKALKAEAAGKDVVVSPRIEGKGVIEVILDLYKSGLTKKEIIAKGYNRSTVQRQVGEYLKKAEIVAPVEDAAPGI